MLSEKIGPILNKFPAVLGKLGYSDVKQSLKN